MAKTMLAAFALGAATLPGVGAAQPAPVEAFARMPSFRDVALSPSGDRFLALYRPDDAGEYRFVVIDRSQGLDTLFVTEQTDEMRVSNPVWLTDDRILFTIRFNAQRYGTDTVETRLMTLNPETGEISRLFKDPRRGEGEMPVQIEDDIVSYLWDDPDSVLVQYREGRSGTKVFQVATDKRRRHRTVQRDKADIHAWEADEAGVLRSGWGIEDDKRQKLIVRTPDGAWKDISHRVAEDAPGFEFVGFPNKRDKAFVAAAHETDTAALYVYDIPTDSFERRLFHDEGSDVYGLVQQRGTGAALGVITNDDAGVHWFGDNFVRDILDRMEETFPDHTLTVTGINAPQTHATLLVEPDGRPGAYVLLDIASNQATRLPPQYPALEGRDLGAVLSVSYEARDGLTIPAYVTLPPGMADLGDAQDVPFVMFPHGGPGARDFAGFDWWAQAVAAQGYGVMQMNFRGSTGYGESFRAAGERQWGQAMQDDIEDGARWLVSQGHADGGRLAIMGGSYGGYAALMGVVKTPDLYRCAAAFAPVTDLPRLLARADDYVGGEYRNRHVGRLWKDRAMLRENSPALHADRIKVPVLLVHGEEDRIVDIDQSERMVTGMKRQDVAHRYVALPGGNHHLTVGDNRLTFLRELQDFLGGCLG